MATSCMITCSNLEEIPSRLLVYLVLRFHTTIISISAGCVGVKKKLSGSFPLSYASKCLTCSTIGSLTDLSNPTNKYIIIL